MEESECCGAEIKWTDICSECGEHTEPKKPNKEFTFSVPCSLEYTIYANDEKEAKDILLEKGGYEIQGEISVDGSDYENAILI